MLINAASTPKSAAISRATTTGGRRTALLTSLGVCLGVLFVFKYLRRAGRRAEKTAAHSLWLEIVWSVIPLMIMLFLFAWGWH